MVSQAEARCERVRIILGEVALAGCRVDDTAGDAADRGVRHAWRQGRLSAVLLPGIREVVVAKTIIESEFARDFPRILREERDEVLACPQAGRRVNRAGIDQSEEETRVGKSNGPAIDG